MKKPSCQDILRHVSPFGRGGCQSSTAERSHSASGSPTRQVLSCCSAGTPLFLLGTFSAPSPFSKSPSWVSYHHSLLPWLCDSAHCRLPVPSTTGPIYPGHQVPSARPPFNSSLCAPASTNSVSAYGILQESCYLLTVLLQVKRTCLHPSQTVK